jgi:predicted RNase H-like HicB family nuclease
MPTKVNNKTRDFHYYYKKAQQGGSLEEDAFVYAANKYLNDQTTRPFQDDDIARNVLIADMQRHYLRNCRKIKSPEDAWAKIKRWLPEGIRAVKILVDAFKDPASEYLDSICGTYRSKDKQLARAALISKMIVQYKECTAQGKSHEEAWSMMRTWTQKQVEALTPARESPPNDSNERTSAASASTSKQYANGVASASVQPDSDEHRPSEYRQPKEYEYSHPDKSEDHQAEKYKYSQPKEYMYHKPDPYKHWTSEGYTFRRTPPSNTCKPVNTSKSTNDSKPSDLNQPPFNPYTILGFPTDAATSDEIKRVYRKLALQYHPDKTRHLNGEERAAANAGFTALANAYEVLTDKAKRLYYDTYRQMPPSRYTGETAEQNDDSQSGGGSGDGKGSESGNDEEDEG